MGVLNQTGLLGNPDFYSDLQKVMIHVTCAASRERDETLRLCDYWVWGDYPAEPPSWTGVVPGNLGYGFM